MIFEPPPPYDSQTVRVYLIIEGILDLEHTKQFFPLFHPVRKS